MKPTRYFILGTMTFIVIEALLFFFVDRPLSEYLRTVDANQHALIDFFRSITDFGKSKWYLWPCAFGTIVCIELMRIRALKPVVKARARIACGQFLFLFIGGAVAGIITDIIKPILGRARPVELEQHGFYGFHPLTFEARWNSMPSGHATSVFAFAFVVSSYFPRFRIPLFLLATFMALSRVMVNAHYLSDVVAGAWIAYLTITAMQGPFGQNGIFQFYKRIFPIDAGKPIS